MSIHDPCARFGRLPAESSESPWLEFKVNNKDPREIGEYVSALANSTVLAGRDRAFLVFGVEDRTKQRVGTLPAEDYQAVSAVIAESIKLGRISPADPDQGRRNAQYVPYWAA